MTACHGMMKIRPLAFMALIASATALHAAERRAPAPAPSPSPTAPALDSARLKAMKARAIGPATMGGRISEVAFDPADPYTFYLGLAHGGVMKTTNEGASFTAQFDKEAVASIGALAVSPADPKVVWVGTGEANDRNSSGWGNGVYRSTDAGATWTHAGLKTSRVIARVVAHPTDAATAWAACLGDLWSSGGERGVYKTTDGGKAWTQVLAASAPYGDRVGAGDLAIDPSNPSVLYATLYARRRTPWSFASGASATDGKDLGGIFKTSDGGATWKKLGGGLPASTARIGLSVSRRTPAVVMAVVQSDVGGVAGIGELESRAGGVFRSTDSGETWTRTSRINPRPFYFSQIRIDPTDDTRVYLLGFTLLVSEDGGRTFREDRSGKVHPDLHALEIDPRQPKRLLLGTDGGAYLSHDRAESWPMLSRFTAGEFYRINVDARVPYRICGGLQDNQNWLGPSRTRKEAGIVNEDWVPLGGGDGFYCVFDGENDDLVYTESQKGSLFRIDLRSGQTRDLRPEPAEGQPEMRYHWNAPLIGSRHRKDTLYLAGHRVFELTQKGEHWRAVSPDLSYADPAKVMTSGSGAETYGVVHALAESPKQAGLLWAGTDDGRLWLTEDGGEHWTELTASLPASLKGQWMTRIAPSAHDAKVAYLAVDAHRAGVMTPLVFRTADRGRTWQSVAGDLPADGPVRVIAEDPTNEQVLYAGTEFGLFASVDRGQRWTRFGELPTVAVDDLLVHPRENDLVVATHGRSLYVIDDLAPLQALTADVRARSLHLFPPRAARASHLLPDAAAWSGSAVFRAPNPPEGALLTYWLRDYQPEGPKITIKDAGGRVVTKIDGPGAPGLNRVAWDLKLGKDLLAEYRSQGQKFLPAGTYTVEVARGADTHAQKLTLELLPGVETY